MFRFPFAVTKQLKSKWKNLNQHINTKSFWNKFWIEDAWIVENIKTVRAWTRFRCTAELKKESRRRTTESFFSLFVNTLNYYYCSWTSTGVFFHTCQYAREKDITNVTETAFDYRYSILKWNHTRLNKLCCMILAHEHLFYYIPFFFPWFFSLFSLC